MLENTERNSRDFSVYDKMATEDLEMLLLADIDSDDQVTDMEVLCYVMELITKREKESGIPRKTTQDAYAEFREKYMYSDDLTDAEDIEVEPQSEPKKKVLWLNRIGKAVPRVAVIAIAVLVFSATLIMSVDALRIPVLRFVNTHFPNHSLLSVAEQMPEYYPHNDPEEAIKDAPVPEGFKINMISIGDSYIRAYYTDKASNYINIQIISKISVAKYDSEGYERSCVTINGQEALFFVKDNDLQVLWLDEENNIYYLIGARNLGADELLKIADYWVIQQIRFSEG